MRGAGERGHIKASKRQASKRSRKFRPRYQRLNKSASEATFEPQKDSRHYGPAKKPISAEALHARDSTEKAKVNFGDTPVISGGA